ncbi:hypothetical protein HXX76_013929 [Chlamydomonas incerta]|uniref:Uncharacterized protein n=1 Tax=Chlamydomonas incerta TaxID=51695 RepID=A0A835SQX5_CHLIN|nr:hypothetical protein HXX76_013929 [Chlamydomonas incerta]|eukprot:KAG2425175.1 hypothetical protein HXX76_013929 [Chlamydomonas incerta]
MDEEGELAGARPHVPGPGARLGPTASAFTDRCWPQQPGDERRPWLSVDGRVDVNTVDSRNARLAAAQAQAAQAVTVRRCTDGHC